MKFFIILLGIVFLLPSCSMAKPYIATLTCEEYWAYHEKMIDIHSPKEEENKQEYMKQLSKFWDYELSRFMKKNKDFDLTLLKELEAGQFNVMLIYQACKFHGDNLKNNASENMQKVLYNVSFNKTRLEETRDNNCKLHNINSFNIVEDNYIRFFYECMNRRSGTLKTSIIDDSTVELCINPKRDNICKVIKPSQEGYCLSRFGSCRQDNKGQCAWEHTNSSKKCSQ